MAAQGSQANTVALISAHQSRINKLVEGNWRGRFVLFGESVKDVSPMKILVLKGSPSPSPLVFYITRHGL